MTIFDHIFSFLGRLAVLKDTMGEWFDDFAMVAYFLVLVVIYLLSLGALIL